MVTIQFGPGNSVQREYTHTDQVRNDTALYQFLGASPANTELCVNGAVYSGPVYPGDTVVIQTKANSKA